MLNPFARAGPDLQRGRRARVASDGRLPRVTGFDVGGKSGVTSRRSTTFAFWVAAVSLMASFATSASPIPLYNTYRADNGISNADLALTVVAYFVGTIFALLSLGRLANHVGRRPASGLSLLLLGAGAVVLMGVNGTATLIIGRALMGVGAGLASSALTSYIVDAAPSTPRWLASVVASQAPMLGLTLGALTSGAIVQYGPRPRLVVYLTMVAALVICAVLLLAAPETVTPRPGVLASLRPRVAIPSHARRLLPVAATVFVGTWAIGAFYQAFVPAIVAEQLHTDNALIVALVFAGFMAPSVVGAPIGGLFTPAASQRLGMLVFLTGMAGALTSLFAGAIVAFVVSSVVAGTGQGMAVSAGIRGMLHGTGIGDRAPLMAAIYLVCYFGATVPSLIAGQLSHVVPLLTIASGYGVLALLATVVTLVFAGNPDESPVLDGMT